VEKKVGRVVAALRDPFDAVNGQGFARLRAAGVHVEEGLLAKEFAMWLSPFLLSVRKQSAAKQTIVMAAKWAQSLDGCLADDTGRSQWITGPLARQYTHWLRRKYDGILVGAGTLLDDAPRLDARNEKGEPLEAVLQPLRFVFDPGARLLCVDEPGKVRLRLGTLSTGTPLVVITSRRIHDDALTRRGVRAWCDELEKLGVVFHTFDAPTHTEGLLSVLEGADFSSLRPGPFFPRPVQSVLVEGGPTLLNALLAARKVDVCHAFVAPLFLGGVKFRLGGLTELGNAERFVPLASFAAGTDVVWEFAPKVAADALFLGI
jgi:diaminohydroxyphosphoribosylaminopyrimidine deaminase/5-amino-6-(5-phosphoribosylamino)uracil reductase